jgi:hypothetical protein
MVNKGMPSAGYGRRPGARTRMPRGVHDGADGLPRRRLRPMRPVTFRAETTWRPLAVVAGLVAVAAAVLLYANRELAGDLFWLLAAGRYVDAHGAGAHDPFLTIAHGGHWYNQQWLSEWLLFQVQRLGGVKLVSFVYALLLAGTLAPLAWGCRRRGLLLVLGAFVLFLGSAVCVLQPRAAGLSLLAFALVVTIVYAARRRRAWLLLLPPLFAVWANLHGAFLAGLLFVGLSALSAAVARRGGRIPHLRLRPAIPLAAAAAGGAAALLLTPLGPGLFDYMRQIGDNHALPLLTHEWLPTWQHPPALALLVAFCAFALMVYRTHPKPRPLGPALIAIGFALFALSAARQAVWLGPVAFHLVRELGPHASWRVPRRLALPAAALAAATLLVWWIGVPPAPTQANLMTAGADYAAAHPPRRGRILTPTGTGSYMLWRHPRTRIVVDGRLERYSGHDLMVAYRLLGGTERSLSHLRRWHVGAVLTRNRRGAAVLRAHGFRLRARVGGSYYLTAP